MLLTISLRADPPGTMLTLVHKAWPNWRPRCQTSAPTSAPAGKLCWRTLDKTLAVGG
jgi:hypothetical protein